MSTMAVVSIVFIENFKIDAPVTNTKGALHTIGRNMVYKQS